MLQRLKVLVQSIRDSFARSPAGLGTIINTVGSGARNTLNGFASVKGTLLLLGVVGGTAYVLYQHPPVQGVGRGEVGVRTNLLTGSVSEWQDGTVFVLPGLHEMRLYQMRDQSYRPEKIASA